MKTNTARPAVATYTFSRSKQLFEQARQVIPAGGQATRLPPYEDYPTYFERAKGCRVWDVDGNEFIDFQCSIGPIILGYAYDRVDHAVAKVIETSFQFPMNSVHQIELAQLLGRFIPGCDKCRFFKTGSEATHAAVRLARSITKRDKIARSGYHGWFDMWWTAESSGVHAGSCEPIVAWDGTPQHLKDTLDTDRDGFAAVILCPSTIKPFEPQTFRDIMDIAQRHGTLVIFDEVKTGFRDALGGIQEVMGVTPDITTVSKAMGNGYPIAAVCGRHEVMDMMVANPSAGTFSVEAIGLVAAIETLRELEAKNAPAHLRAMGQRLIDGFNQIAQSHGIAVEAFAEPIPQMPNLRFTDQNEKTANKVKEMFFREVIRRGLFMIDWHMHFINLSHQSGDIDQALEICDFVLDRMKRTL